MNRALLHEVYQLADDMFRPNAATADQQENGAQVRDNLKSLASAGFFGLGIAPEFGGLGADIVTRHEFAEILASACGVTAFTQQQLQTGIRYVAESRNVDLKAALLPELAAGRSFCGVAISHLRRSGTPLVCAEAVPGGYRVNGRIPWITGWSLLDGFVLGATVTEGGEHLFAYVDKAKAFDALRPDLPLPLIVMNASETVEVDVENLFVPMECVLQIQSPTVLARDDDRMLTAHTALPLGCARGGIRALRALAETRASETLCRAIGALTFETDQCRREALTWHCDCVGHPDYKANALRTRTWAIVLAMRAAHAAVAATGGRAHLKTSTPQRLLREAQFYTTAVQTSEIQGGTLDQLISPFFGY